MSKRVGLGSSQKGAACRLWRSGTAPLPGVGSRPRLRRSGVITAVPGGRGAVDAERDVTDPLSVKISAQERRFVIHIDFAIHNQ